MLTLRKPSSSIPGPSPTAVKKKQPRAAPGRTASRPAGSELAEWASPASAAPRRVPPASLPSNPREAEKKRITEVALAAVDPSAGLRLGGSRALAVHGLTERLTDDIDLFSPGSTGYQQEVVDALRAAGYTVEAEISGTGATLMVTWASGEVELEMCSSLPLKDAPVLVEGVPVMSVADCVRLKFSAVNGDKRRDKDLIDVCGILENLGPDHLQQLMSDRPLDQQMLPGFFRRLKRAADLDDEAFAPFGVAPDRAAWIRHYLVQQSGRADELEEQFLARLGPSQPRTARKNGWWTSLLSCWSPQAD